MRSFIVFVFMSAGILFVSALAANHFPQMKTTAFNLPDPNGDIGTTYPVSYWLLFMLSLVILALWSHRSRKGRR